ncbi:ABC transporter permease [Francisella philomiragia]|uniref:ABC transporter permease n=1 Tax=Francisella philomiragia TaxID=28110 RepID=UPI001903D41D|nr:ABC transporter permease [Francisella philomiragia]MBK2267760.1 ABC transporter permease [Francisella philomiragia]MBK2279142.1 ABC transporter permease [Francisella philomiragia]MBK2287069.1 ABC transporter permease [Francisella philomiragia]MBK2288974.1 ABC transporter permease [Francisella philomiragia]MBK2290692.1 ABC transporter permease [Francisella philomiragia]
MRYFKEFYRFIRHLINNNRLILILSYNDFKEAYLGSYLGIVWAVIRPVVFILVIWLVFTYGIRPGGAGGSSSIILFLLTGMIPWFFFSDAFSKSSEVLIAKSFLVTKVSFSVNILPIVSIMSCFIIHMILIFILFLAFTLAGHYPSIYWLQLPYYLLCSLLLLLGLGWLASALRVFVKDTSEVVALITQFGFWFTPVFWSPQQIPERYRFLIDLNPMAYVIQGFRNTFIEKVWFWQQPVQTIVFMIMVFCIVFFGAIVFKRLAPHFGDVL